MQEKTNIRYTIGTKKVKSCPRCLPILAGLYLTGNIIVSNKQYIYNTLSNAPKKIEELYKKSLEEGHKKIKRIPGNY